MADRSYVVPLIERYLPTSGALVNRGTVGMDHIVKDWGNKGTTCGYLPHWLWWRMGCQDTKLMCRYEPDTPFKYSNGFQINRVYAHAEFTKLGAGHGKTANDDKYVKGDIFPQRGDAIIIQGVPNDDGSDSSHIFIALDAGEWVSDTKGTYRVAETGQTANGGHIASRTVEYKNGKWNMGKKWMLGWLDIDKIVFGKPRTDLDYLSSYAKDSVPASAADMIGIWRVTAASESWFYFFYKGFRVFYSNVGAPETLQGGGYWHPRSPGFNIRWDWGNQEQLTLTSKTTAKGSWGNGPLEATKVTSSSVTMGKFSGNVGAPF